MFHLYLIQGQRLDLDSVTSSRHGADVGAVISNIKSVLKLIGESVMLVPEYKRSITQILHALLSEKVADASVLLCILDVIKGWIENDYCKPTAAGTATTFLNAKEIVSFLQKLSQVDKQAFSPLQLEEWDKKYLELLYGICADSNRYAKKIVFQQVTSFHLLTIASMCSLSKKYIIFEQISSFHEARCISESGKAVHAWFEGEGP